MARPAALALRRPRVGSSPRVASAAVGGGDRVASYEERHSPLDLGDEPGRIAPGTRVSYVPGAGLLVRKEALDEIGGFDASLRCGEDVDAVWRLAEAGWRWPLRTGRRRHHQPRRTWRASSSSAALRRVGSGPRRRPRQCRRAGADERVEPRRVGIGRRRTPVLAAGVAGGTALALIPKLRGVPAPSRCGSPARSPRRRPLAGDAARGGRGCRSSVVARVVAACPVDRRRRRCAGALPRAVRRASSTTWRTASASGRACSTAPAGAAAPRRRRPGHGPRTSSPMARRRILRRGTALDAAPHRRHRRVARPRRARRRRYSPIVPVVKGNGYGFGRSELARIAEELVSQRPRRVAAADTIAVGTVTSSTDCRRGCGRWCSRRPSSWRRRCVRPDEPSDRHRRRPRPRRCPRRLAGAVLIKLASSMRRFGVAPRPTRRLRARIRAAGLTVDRLQHPPAAGGRRRRPPRRGRPLAGGPRRPPRRHRRPVGQPSRPDAYAGLRCGWPTVALPDPDRHGAVARRQVGAAPRRRRPRRSPRVRRLHRRLPRNAGDRRRLAGGRGRHRPRHVRARRRTQPVPLPAPAPRPARAAAHAHVDGVRPDRRDRARRSATSSTCSARSRWWRSTS